MNKTINSRLRAIPETCLCILLVIATLSAGCATSNPRDPLEPMNRKVYAFNKALDSAIIKPVAVGYDKVIHRTIRKGVSNFFRNLRMVVTTLNDALQLKYEKVPVDIMRFSTNLVFGLGGVIDVATDLRMPYHEEDFGQTLGYWGVSSGPYLVLPFFGPSNIRDGLGLPVDIYVNPLFDQVDDEGFRIGLIALSVIDTRANLLQSEKFLRQASLDEYSFLRDSYLQRREYLIRDGAAPSASDVDAKDRPKTLEELEAEEFGDDPLLDDYDEDY